MEIKVLGPGCRNCEKLAEEAKRAAKETGCQGNRYETDNDLRYTKYAWTGHKWAGQVIWTNSVS